MKWVLGPDEFSYVWENETGLDRRPYPINMAPAGTVRSEREHAALRLPQRFPRQADPDLAAALMVCARPDATTVTVSGERTVRSRNNGSAPHTERILLYAAVVHHHASILAADPKQVTVVMCHARTLGERLVQLIGSARAGRNPALREPQDAVLHGHSETFGSGARPGADPTGEPDGGAARFRKMLRRPVDGRGFVTVTVSPDDPMSPPTRHRSWLDLSGDGRYLLTTAHDLTLTPVDDAEFAAQLTRLAQIR
ncbi:ESX secretion-associated protein EspG [Nocardia asteroides]|uniref:ESX secretion-associated protein EspG n=1 Tax=Nocardia asteroides TaxID=1824 RepID=UPI001E594A9C|nr:ESX secretion-associated protein EspG [Nocardia asteroides]UGT64697.1 ESX secretion-associated protein EspG [Nocardia asteroides]